MTKKQSSCRSKVRLIKNRFFFFLNRRRKRKLQPQSTTNAIIAPETLQLPSSVPPPTLNEGAETPPLFPQRGAILQPQQSSSEILPSMASVTYNTTHETTPGIIETCTNKKGNPFSIDRLIAK